VRVCKYVNEAKSKEVTYTVCVPQTRTETFNVTTYKSVPEQRTVTYNVCVPEVVEREVDVTVCKMVPKTIQVPVHRGCGCCW
jgi:hypothetical protein